MLCQWGRLFLLRIYARGLLHGAHCAFASAWGGGGGDRAYSTSNATVSGIDVEVWAGACEDHLYAKVYGSMAGVHRCNRPVLL